MSRLLVVRLSALGDVIHTIPAVVALKERFEIGWAVEKPYGQLVELVAGVPAVPVSLKRWSAVPDARRAVQRYDVSVDFQGLIKSSALAWASGAKERWSFDGEAIREKPALVFTNRRVAVDQTRHVIEWNLQLAQALHPGAAMPAVDFLPFADPARHGRDIVLLPAAGRPEKQWPVERFRQLAKRIGPRAIAVWGPGEEELARQIGCRMAPRTNLRELAAILRDAEVVIGGDTGPLHLAAALGTKVVGLYGPTNPRRNGPYGQLDRCISTFEGERKMEAIGVEEVVGLLETEPVSS
ncbi:MAG TPA: glycosyltransferase family 9 protein [Thermoanaerobaculia bacterium]|jgi:lipopolysaccharide heptosyltransferase I|nr:glycosyltransferase family 9 protein [Thermoanaerobaculia bacterium]